MGRPAFQQKKGREGIPYHIGMEQGGRVLSGPKSSG